MINNVIEINKKGSSHEQCEDSICVDRVNSVFITCDGVSNSLNGGAGAKFLSEYIHEKISNERVKKHLALDPISNVRNAMVKFIKESTELITKELVCDAEDIASTMIVVSVWEDIITVIHAGDGAVFAAPEVCQDEVPLILSYPDNDAKQHVFPAASPRQLERMRVVRIKASDIKCLAFGSDGFTDAFLRPSTNGFNAYGLNEIFKLNDNNELEELIKRKHLKQRPVITDDISAIIIKFSNDVEYNENTRKDTVETLAESPNKLAIKSTNETILETNDDSNSAIEKDKSKSTNNINKVVLSVLSVLIISCMILVFALGNRINTINDNSNKKVSTLSEEVSNLQNRIDELENIIVEDEISTDIDTTTTNSINSTEDFNNDEISTREDATTEPSTEPPTLSNYTSY